MNINIERQRRMVGCQRTLIFRPCSQRGLVLLFSLIVLIAMTLAGIALVRSVDTASLIAGNLAFRQSAEASGNEAVEQAAGFLANSISLVSDNPNSGYFASKVTLDITGNATPNNPYDNIDWKTMPSLPKDAAGNTAYYMVYRMCDSAGAIDPNSCNMVAVDSTEGNTIGSRGVEMPYQPKMLGSGYLVYYSVIVQVRDARDNPASYLQAIMTGRP